jgi:hypothetical protein
MILLGMVNKNNEIAQLGFDISYLSPKEKQRTGTPSTKL